MAMSALINLHDYEAAAGVVLGPSALGYYAGGAMDEVTLRENRAAWDRIRGLTRALVQRAEAPGYAALVLTADAPVLGRRERDVRSAFAPGSGLGLGNLQPEGISELPPPSFDSAVAAHFAAEIEPALTWRDWNGCAKARDCPSS